MLRLSFVTPAALALLLVLPALWALGVVTPRRVARWRRWSSLVARTLIFVALVLALAGAQLVRPVRELTTIFLLDGSDSVAPSQRDRALAYIEESLAALPSHARAGLIVFGENALVELTPSQVDVLGRVNSLPDATRTDIERAIQLGLALFPSDTQKRLVLLSDGGANNGDAIEAARIAAVRGVPIDVVYLPGDRGPDVIVSAFDAPGAAREGQEIGLGVSVDASYDTSGRLLVFVDGQIAAEQEVVLRAGSNDFALRVPAGDAGFRRLEVRLDAEGDTQPQNNRAAAYTEVVGPPRLLLIASAAERAANLATALEAAGARVDLLPPDQAPADLAQLGDYAGVVIVDTPSRDLPRALMEALPAYVHDLGRGLAMVGGSESFGAGGYRRTPLEPVLPVRLDPDDTSEQPDIALVLVIDRSGSMDLVTSGRSKLDLAKEAVYQASLGLSDRDQIGLVAFDVTAEWIIDLRRLPPAIEIERALSSFDASGGTDIRPGVELAATSLAQAQARIKHMILLTDGIAESNYDDLVDRMRAGGVTISTVAIGGDANPNLERIAERGGGRFYRVLDVNDVPSIFLQETVLAAGRDIIEEQITPQIGLPSPVVRGLGGLPPLYGYNGTEVRDAARTILFAPDGRPILAQWQYGLGSVVAWTSDFKGQWGRDWVAWDQFPRFAGGLVDLLLPSRFDERLSLQASSTGAQSVLEVTAQDDQGRPLDNLALTGQLIDPQDESRPIQFAQVGAGRYRAVVATTVPGVYLARVAALDQQGDPLGTTTSGLVVSYSPEYGAASANPQLLSDLAVLTSGRVDPPATAVFDPVPQTFGAARDVTLPLVWLALLLWPIDIALRRLFVPVDRLRERVVLLRPRRRVPPRPVNEPLTRLSAAKQRAALRTPSSARATPSAQAPRAASSRSDEPGRAATGLGARQQPPDASAPRTPPAERGDEQFARLLAAKRRARGNRDRE